MPRATRRDLYAEITTNIIAAIEAGPGEFILPWHGACAGLLPKNPLTGRYYSGLNHFILMIAAQRNNYPESLWATYRQWQQIGRQVVKGARGTMTILYKPSVDRRTGEAKTDEDGRPLVYIRASYLFNIAQTDGYSAPADQNIPGEVKIAPQDRAEAVIAATGADIRIGGARAAYFHNGDFIVMPDRCRFDQRDGNDATGTWYATLFHELVHWTGQPDRLARDKNTHNRQAYAYEELVAELGSAFLMAELDIANQPVETCAAYLGSWLHALKNDNRFIFRAAADATRAASFILSMSAQSSEEGLDQVA